MSIITDMLAAAALGAKAPPLPLAPAINMDASGNCGKFGTTISETNAEEHFQ
jgi:hypothetical protein